MRKITLLITVVLIALMAAACASDAPESWHGDSVDGVPPSGSGPRGRGDGEESVWGGGDLEMGENGQGNQRPRPSPGQLTCGEWSDIKNYGFYLDLFEGGQDDDQDVAESQRRNNYAGFAGYFGFETRYMLTVNVVAGGSPVGDAVVELYDSSGEKLFTAKTDKRGNAFLFPYYDVRGESVTIKASSGAYQAEETFARADAAVQITLDGRAAPADVLDVMFVVDTTGSMGDEIRYLKSEIDDVIGKIKADNPNYTINLALLFYRDIGDEYVTRYFDFTTNIAQQRSNLERQVANGGGDFPEAADRALEEAAAKNWTAGSATRLIFHVCDAPPHSDQESQTRYFNAVKAAAQKGIRIIPVASSGIDLATEFLLRQEALMTGGTYIFLTDDSGIGDSHMTPTVGEFTVEYLNNCMVRVVNEYLTGIATDPIPYYGNVAQ